MINLLADSHKAEIRAGRTNVIALRYIILTAAAIVILGAIVGIAFFTLGEGRRSAQANVEESIRNTNEFSSVTADATEFRTNLQTAKQILDKEVTYSGAILKIARAIPSGVVLDQLNLSPESIGQPIQINAKAKSREAALNLKTSFEREPAIFSDIYFNSITLADESSGEAEYPVTVQLTLTINQGVLQ